MAIDEISKDVNPLVKLSRVSIFFSNGDICLQSRDGHKCQVDSIALRRASPVLSSMIDQHSAIHPNAPNPSEHPLELDEDAAMLDIFLRSIHPPFSTAGVTGNEDRALATFRFMEKYQLSPESALWVAAKATITDTDDPVEAWCEALRNRDKAALTRARTHMGYVPSPTSSFGSDVARAMERLRVSSLYAGGDERAAENLKGYHDTFIRPMYPNSRPPSSRGPRR